MVFDFFATCPKGMEQLLLQELQNFELDTKETVAGVKFQASIPQAYEVCLWSRIANKVLLSLGKMPVTDANDLYRAVQEISWSDHLRSDGNLWIDFNGTNDEIRNTQFAAQKVKDAIVDQFRSNGGDRPSIDRQAADLIVNVKLTKDFVNINIDLCGESLHRRGYRVDTVKAPLKENLAAALLLRCDWPNIAAQCGTLIDPMCGSGTLLIEAALMAADYAPGLLRYQSDRYFVFERWLQHKEEDWKRLIDISEERMLAGMEKQLPDIFGYDENVLAIRAAERNLAAIGFDGWINVRRKSLADFKRPTHQEVKPGVVISNPPYGERLSDEETLRRLYQELGDALKIDFQGWQAGVFTGNPNLGKCVGLRARKKYKLFNGALASELLLFDITEDNFYRQRLEAVPEKPLPTDIPSVEEPLSANATMVANRFRKNFKQLKPWLVKNQIENYRLYDADIPEYAAAIDVYHDIETEKRYFHLQEYMPPKTINPELAQQRLQDLVHATIVVFELPDEQLSIKQRTRQKGSDQYQALTKEPFEDMVLVREGKARLWANLWAYLDTGLFLDHRPLRRWITEESCGKSVLNLFCYTASVSVQAILGGAISSISVDMSKTYIQWARKNYQINDVDERKHQLVQADCLTWLQQCRQAFDIIVLDPPTFSNSKRMEDVLDIQRDHVNLIRRCMEILTPNGQLYFSNNLRKFKLDEEKLAKYQLTDVSEQSIDKDFKRNSKIHRCWKISAKK